MNAGGSRERMESSAPASRIERAVVRVWVGVSVEGIRAFCWSRASFALDSWDFADEASFERRECCRDERIESREELWEVAEGMVQAEADASGGIEFDDRRRSFAADRLDLVEDKTR